MHVTENNKLACTVVGAVPTEMTMIPAKLAEKGYTSHHIGKWQYVNPPAAAPAPLGKKASWDRRLTTAPIPDAAGAC